MSEEALRHRAVRRRLAGDSPPRSLRRWDARPGGFASGWPVTPRTVSPTPQYVTAVIRVRARQLSVITFDGEIIHRSDFKTVPNPALTGTMS